MCVASSRHSSMRGLARRDCSIRHIPQPARAGTAPGVSEDAELPADRPVNVLNCTTLNDPIEASFLKGAAGLAKLA